MMSSLSPMPNFSRIFLANHLGEPDLSYQRDSATHSTTLLLCALACNILNFSRCFAEMDRPKVVGIYMTPPKEGKRNKNK